MLHALIMIGFNHQIKKRCYIRAVTKGGKERMELRKHFAVSDKMTRQFIFFYFSRTLINSVTQSQMFSTNQKKGLEF